MLKLFITLQVTAFAVIAALEDRTVKHRRDERGSVTIEQVIWAGAVILIVGIVVAAIRAFVTSEAGKIR
jgi:heme/copper-type cytochrome/quinol oxidase subunit 2